jgi:hypothetical protein
MRALVYADVQATDGHEKCFNDPTKSLQIGRVTAFYDRLLQIYQEKKCDCLWDLGDTTDDRSAIPVPAISSVCTALSQFPLNEWNLKLIGNHEQYLRNAKVHVGQMFAPYFSVVETNSAYVCGCVRILCCSYPGYNAESDTVAWIEAQKAVAQRARQHVVLLGHFPVMGCMTGDGRLLAGIPKETISWVDLGLLGHIHKPQSVSKRVHYVGSPFQQNWGETGESKRVGIVDISNLTVEWVTIEGFPIYQTVNLADFKELCTAETDDRFKVVLKSQAEAATFYALPLVHRAEPIYEFVEETEEYGSAESAQTTGHKWSFDSVIQRYVERNTPDSKGILASIEEMVDYGKTIAIAP